MEKFAGLGFLNRKQNRSSALEIFGAWGQGNPVQVLVERDAVPSEEFRFWNRHRIP